MAVFLKKVKRELEKGKRKVGSHTPPNYVWRNTGSYPNLAVSKFDNRFIKGTNQAEYKGVVKSEGTSSGSPSSYKVTVRFNDVKFQNKAPNSKRAKDLMKTLVLSGQKVWFYPPTFDKNPVQMKCSCQDFRHRFETQLSKFGGIIGAPRKYKRLTDAWPVGRPYANHADPTDGSAKIAIQTASGRETMSSKLGYCKHIHSLLFYLKKEGHVAETRREL
jgi:hypothetical protein